MKNALFVLLLLLTPSVAGELFEDFEDDTVGQPPMVDVFPWTQDGIATVQTEGRSGALALFVSGGSKSGGASGIGGDAFDRYRANLKADCGPGHNSFDSFLSLVTSTVLFRLDVNRDTCTINFRSDAVYTDLATVQDFQYFSYELQLANQGGDLLVRVLIDDSIIFSQTITSVSIGTLNQIIFTIQNAAEGLTRFAMDDLCAGVECLPVVLQPDDIATALEFDNALGAFAASAGFISQESQLFFALILIGLATVTTSASSKWVSPGKFKNYLLMSVQTLVAVFCVIAAFLDLWMFLVAFMLALFAVRGGSEVRNSFHEIREALQRQNDRAGDDIGPTQVMEVQVSEREEAVERAFQRLEDQSGATDTVEAHEGTAEAVSDDAGGDA